MKMKTIILICSLFFSILTYTQPTSELKIASIDISFFDQYQNKISFNKRRLSYKDKNNKKSVVSFFLKSYEVDIDSEKSTPGKITKEDLDFINNEFIFLFYPYYQRLGWEKAVIKEELIIEWKKNKKLMKIIVRPNINEDLDLLNPPHINISFKAGVYEITDLEKPTCCNE